MVAKVHRSIIEHRLVNVAEAVLDPRHDIAFELIAALLAPSHIVRCISHRSNDTVFARLVILVGALLLSEPSPSVPHPHRYAKT
jgi:hypothetical protein